MEINVLPGWRAGTSIRFPRAGNERPAAGPQDIVFIVEEIPHPRFTRTRNDLIVILKMPLVEALIGMGEKKTVEHLDGRRLQVSIPPGVVKPGQETTLSGEGMPMRKDGRVCGRGDLIVKWEIVFPNHLTPSQKDGIEGILGWEGGSGSI